MNLLEIEGIIQIPLAYAESVYGGGPSTGTLLAAVLETAGYQAQSNILQYLSSMLKELGALVFCGVLISIFITTALSGHYRAALWILIGPAIFFMVVNIRTRANGAEWQFGSFRDRQLDNRLEHVLENTQINRANTGFEVSNLFHIYNTLVSQLLQRVISIITNDKMLPQMQFMARQKIMDDLYSIELDNANLKGLLAFFYAHCNQEIAYATMIGIGNQEQRRKSSIGVEYSGFRNSPEYEAAVKYYCQRFPKRDKPFPPGPWQTYVVETLKESPNPEVAIAEYRSGRVTRSTVSCAQLWRWTIMGSRRHVGEHSEILRKTDIETYGERVYGEQFWQKVLNDIGVKIGGLGNGNNLDPCPNVAERFSSQINSPPVLRYFAGMLVRDALVKDPRGMMIEQFVEHGRITTERSDSMARTSDPGKKEKIIRRLRAHQLSESQKYEVFWLSMALPYLQGMILYALAATFPFFAMMLLVPGQAGAFLAWMALWVWAKSWDVGWALVMVIDNVLWEFLPKVSYYDFPNQEADRAGDFDTPVNLFETIFSGDHSYSLTSYWLLLTLMVGGIPVLSAQVVLGSKKAIAGMLIDGLRAMGAGLSGSAGDWIAHEQIERNDVRTVHNLVSSVKIKSDVWWSKMRERYDDYKEKYGASLFTRVIGRPISSIASTVQVAGLHWLNKLDDVSMNLTGGQAGTAIVNFHRDFISEWDKMLGVPMANLAIKTQNKIVKPTTKKVARAGITTINMARQTGRDFENLWIGVRRVLGSDVEFKEAYTEDIPTVLGDLATELMMPELSERVPERLRKLGFDDLKKMQETAEQEAAETIRLTKQGWEGIIDQLGMLEFELRRKFNDLREDIRLLGVSALASRESNLANKFGLISQVYFPRVSDDEIESQCIIGLSRSFSKSFEGLNARPEIDQVMSEIERVRMRAYLYQTTAEIVGYGSVAIGALVGYATRSPTTAVTVILGGLHAAYQINSTGIDMHRMVNSREADCLALNAEVWLYDAMQSQSWYFAQEIRAGLSLRGEWWNVPDNPGYKISGDASQLAARVQTEAAYLEGGVIGDLLWTGVVTATKGKAITALK